MKGIAKVMNDIVTTNMTASHSSEICNHCGNEIKAIPVEVLGRTRWVQPVCQCEQDIKKAEVERLIRAKEENEVRTLFSISNIGDRYLNANFDNFLMRQGAEKAFKAAKYYAENFAEFGAESLLLWGDVGNGKTHLAASVHNHLVAQGKVVVFISMPELLGKIRATFNKNNNESEQQIMKALMICDLLIIDDLGAEKISDWVLETMFQIFDGRSRRKKPILATSNLNPKDLPEQIGKRIPDRLIEMSQPVKNEATSYRREIAKGRLSKFDAILNQ
ncbi:ATP-binding protein [Lysinibacillus fusiformis]|uniref:AFG1/ZapE family ATPase n=1 Tax=Lysinibacillus fusiformis TaxID=28031 RepID=UPI0003230FA7|nr:AFG1/ZapE family ATPase [Lysinibacillus fusiformis]MED4076325.1 ATP-binding protein [Lysinibacillus fusiformis]